jgi:hypothetical protein
MSRRGDGLDEAALREEPPAGDDTNLDELTYSTEEVRRELGLA